MQRTEQHQVADFPFSEFGELISAVTDDEADNEPRTRLHQSPQAPHTQSLLPSHAARRAPCPSRRNFEAVSNIFKGPT
jgi:hypothetical protein